MNCPNCGKEEFRGCGNHGWAKGEGLLCTVCGWQRQEYIPMPDKKVWHPRDIEAFTEYPAPIMENMQRIHYCNVNSTIPYFGPMMYFLGRQFGWEQVLEIGHAEGYTSFYLANAVKDNGTRFGMASNHYYGIDIVQTESVQEKLTNAGLPGTVQNKDSMTLTPDSFPGITFDMIFQDGNHDKEHVLYEFDQMWPQVKKGGYGHWIAHDVYGPAEEGCEALLEMIKEKNIPVEFIRFGGMYGLLIIRKMEGYEPEKWVWEGHKSHKN